MEKDDGECASDIYCQFSEDEEDVLELIEEMLFESRKRNKEFLIYK